MPNPRGTFAPELLPEGWFDETQKPEGWFSQDLLDAGSVGNATANGATVNYTTSLIAGSASAERSATASGATVTITESLIAGAASVSDTASGVSLPVNFALLSGNAIGERNASAGGATILQFYEFVAGSANGDTEQPAPLRRGDDAGQSGARERFWRAQAEEWLEERLQAVKRAARGPQRARKRLATRIVADVPSFVSGIPEFAPRLDALERLGQRLAAPAVDYTAIAQAVAAQMALIEAWNTRQRRRRDVEALLILAA